jgi:hypothetical protein
MPTQEELLIEVKIAALSAANAAQAAAASAQQSAINAEISANTLEEKTAKDITSASNLKLLSLINESIRNSNHALLVSRGVVPGSTVVQIVGYNPDVDVGSAPEDIWEEGGQYPFQTSAQSLEIVSSNAADNPSGTGLRTVRITGLDAGYVEITEDITLNGTSPVTLVNQYLRVNLLMGLSVGSNKVNAGKITLRVAGGGAIQSVIGVGGGASQKAIYTVPAGKTAFITHCEFQMIQPDKGDSAGLKLHFNTPGNADIGRALFTFTDTSPNYQRIFGYPLLVPEKSDIRISSSFVSSNNTEIFVTLFLVLMDND